MLPFPRLLLCLAALLPTAAVAVPPVLEVAHCRVTPQIEAAPQDAAWVDAAVIPALGLSLRPGRDEDRVAPPTRVSLLWDEDWLYVRFVCADNDIYTPFTRHDEPLYKGDVVEVFLDPTGDGRQYVELQVSPRNVTLDKLFLLTAEPHADEHGKLLDDLLARDFWEFLDWTLPGLRTAVRRLPKPADGNSSQGWLVDVAIPAGPLLHRLGRTRFEPMSLRANLLRYDWPAGAKKNPRGAAPARSLVALNWAPVLDGCPHISPQAMGSLKLLPP